MNRWHLLPIVYLNLLNMAFEWLKKAKRGELKLCILFFYVIFVYIYVFTFLIELTTTEFSLIDNLIMHLIDPFVKVLLFLSCFFWPSQNLLTQKRVLVDLRNFLVFRTASFQGLVYESSTSRLNPILNFTTLESLGMSNNHPRIYLLCIYRWVFLNNWMVITWSWWRLEHRVVIQWLFRGQKRLVDLVII